MADGTAPTDEQLLDRHLKGDETAFRQIVQRHHRELFQFICRFTHRKSAAEDIVQDAFVQVHVAAHSFDLSRRLKPWLFTIAANKARDHLRSKTRRREVPLDAQIGNEDSGQRFLDLLADEGGDPTQPLADAEKENLVREAVDALPEHLTEVLVLAYYHRFPYRDIADALEIPIGTVKSRLHAAVQQFALRYRAVLQARGQEPDD